MLFRIKFIAKLINSSEIRAPTFNVNPQQHPLYLKSTLVGKHPAGKPNPAIENIIRMLKTILRVRMFYSMN